MLPRIHGDDSNFAKVIITYFEDEKEQGQLNCPQPDIQGLSGLTLDEETVIKPTPKKKLPVPGMKLLKQFRKK